MSHSEIHSHYVLSIEEAHFLCNTDWKRKYDWLSVTVKWRTVKSHVPELR